MLDAAGWSVRGWHEVIVDKGYLEAWNESQRWFGRAELSGVGEDDS